ncbi:MAG: restriction endonuclease [Anaerolineae bacterium]|nr:restriction endonuclease [Anaerolineae bacterium]
MLIGGLYSFKHGREIIEAQYPGTFAEVEHTVVSIDARNYLTKESAEKTMVGRMLYSPKGLNKAFKEAFFAKGWVNRRVSCDYSKLYYVNGYQPASSTQGAFRDMDFIKNHVGVEVQFGKYAFMVYNVCAKMTIFHKLGFINVGIEIVPVKEFADQMSTGVSYFEQFVWDLEHRGASDIDIPVLVLGIAA